ncbi:hydroxyacylglutathione hydrolase [Gallaecimonas sp. GXIMD4217]|uniref:hydroxyacylglutathione hydrolase n=1 Tax=Gallaecimonas sp. GXIMD4217 TaxID=3131927 RepID=UPI00311B0F9C
MTKQSPRVYGIPAFKDNYIWAVETTTDGVAVVDPGDGQVVLDWLAASGRQLTAILITHHHRDHTGGLAQLLARYRVPVFGPGNEPIDGITAPVKEGDQVHIGGPWHFGVIEVPGHTRGHIAFFGHGTLFCGDALFSGGCGRLFEGDAATLHHSLQKLAALPGPTRVYCAHEYTQANLRFAQQIEPSNEALAQYVEEVDALRQADAATLPSTIARERDINPFLRVTEPSVITAAQAYSGEACESPEAVFAALRRYKDAF